MLDEVVGQTRLGPSRGLVILSCRARVRQIQFARARSGQFDRKRHAPIGPCV